jgi:hypothetical protein
MIVSFIIEKESFVMGGKERKRKEREKRRIFI